jgi:predicted ATP-binding protein involved in virulence
VIPWGLKKRRASLKKGAKFETVSLCFPPFGLSFTTMTQQQSPNSLNSEEIPSNNSINFKRKEELEARFKLRDEQRKKQVLSEKENQTENCFSDQLQSIKNFDNQFSMYKHGIGFLGSRDHKTEN